MAASENMAMPAVRWRESQGLVAAECAVVMALTVGHDRVPLSATPFFLVLAWTSLRLRGLGWRDVGLARRHSWPTTLALGALAGLTFELFSTFVALPLWTRLTGRPPDLAVLRPLVGNVPMLLLALAANWLLAAFGEEMVFRGYLMNRVAGFGQGTRRAWLVSLLMVSLLFGACHEVQGLTGILQEGFAGLLLGSLYLACGRTLAVPIIAHGTANTLAFVLIYFDRYPGV